jgi:hypothetical protein
MRGVFGISSFVNGCPMQTAENVKSMQYLQCEQATPYKNKETAANFAFRRGPADQEYRVVAFWLDWWNRNKASLLEAN